MSGKERLGRPPRIKNKNAAEVQITAEQILREANERQESIPKAPKQKITDAEELDDYKLRKRTEFENSIRKNKHNIGNWLRYAAWEESQKELTRARSVFLRALEVDERNVTVRLKYLEMELKNRNINSARNLLDSTTSVLPRVDQFWFKYVHMEEMLDNVYGARAIFERWMKWEPDEPAWNAYIKFEIRYGEYLRARDVHHRFVECHPEIKNWIKWVKFEEEQGNYDKVREIYSSAIDYFGDDLIDSRIFLSFAKFEARMKQFERSRVLFKYALDRIPKSKAEVLYKEYVLFEKKYGDKDGIETLVVGRRRAQYEEETKNNPNNYDTWFDYARLEEDNGDFEKTRDVYERAISQVPPAPEKRLWRRYIYLWINYALFEELQVKDVDRTREVYKACLNLIPHKKFTFAKIWLLYAQFEIRQNNLAVARKSLGMAIGMCPKSKLFRGYIDLEIALREFDRVRILYSKYLEFSPSNCTTWIRAAELEKGLLDIARCRAMFELAINMEVLDMPELLWKAYIDFEYEMEEYGRTRDLYRQLLMKTSHVKVWISFAQFELSISDAKEPGVDHVQSARAVFKEAYGNLRSQGLKEERVLLLESWKEFEKANGTPETYRDVDKKTPKIVKKRRQTEEGETEEYFDYIFPDDETLKPQFKLLEMAHKWKASADNEAKNSEASLPQDDSQRQSE
ncbi:NineTeen Complex (NTC) component [Entomophthora muscae]|uniref:NineTeen Complex (NTC) component n=1 Tax=Entomophthora muscae TaxID=34485 RepID=A0ACC2RM47_9FUNG|nr:NineTeen Complex (NTC) component [Entomophthora muscae]